MPKRVRTYLTRCEKCGSPVGADKKVRSIAECTECHTGKKKKRRRTRRTATSGFASVRKGAAEDLPKKYRGYHFRSAWERNFARVLCKKKIKWTYEERVFTFGGVARRPFQYIPDFHDTDSDVYWEIKGYLRSQDRSKMRRFRKLYPEDFKKLKACLSKSNKTAVAFYKKMGVPMIFIEDLKKEWKDKVKKWE